MTRPEAPAHHGPHRRAGEPEGGGQIDRDDGIPVLVAQLHEQIVPVDAGIGDQDVELFHFGFGVGHQLLDRVLVGEIARQHMHAGAEFGGERIERLRRVPESATVAPCACSARAISPPMPPLAPVTSAVLPVRSNIMGSQFVAHDHIRKPVPDVFRIMRVPP